MTKEAAKESKLNQPAVQPVLDGNKGAGSGKILGTVLTIISASAFALMAIFAKYAYKEDLNLPTILSLRFLIAALIMWVVVLAGRKNSWPGLKGVLAIMAVGGVSYGLQSSFFFGAVRLIPASIASILLYMYPVIVTVLSAWIFRERLTRYKILSLVISLVGLIMVVGMAFQGLNLKGVLFGLGAAVVYSLYLISSNRLLYDNDPVVMTTCIITAAAVVFNTAGRAKGNVVLPDTAMGWWSIAGIAVVSTVIAILTLFQGMKLVGPSRASIISAIEPVVTVAAAALLLGERISWLQIAGGLLVIAAVITLQLEREVPGKE
ncbi:MAG: EamA family transporter [Firmicutes bacterium HGW-Firmicutes-14]|nr:MAG: EamA family transporter [Firmicutes bacterium HGW-Firmicutes-14]